MKYHLAFIKTPDHFQTVASQRGWGNGYVGVDETHPWYGLCYSEVDHLITIHGGLTFSGVLIGMPPKIWWFGFDTAHANDNLKTCPFAYIYDQVNSLFNQLERATMVEEIRKVPGLKASS
jgi:hypothetical protein